MPKPSQVILLVEDSRHQQFGVRFLRRLGLTQHAIRIEKSPSATGSGEQFVRERFAVEVIAYRRRQAQTKLILVIDADNHTLQQRIRHLDHALQKAGVAPIDNETEEIARLVSKRNIETWILCLNHQPVDEVTDYKRTPNDWSQLVRTGVEFLYAWTRPNTAIPQTCVNSLQIGIREIQKLQF